MVIIVTDIFSIKKIQRSKSSCAPGRIQAILTSAANHHIGAVQRASYAEITFYDEIKKHRRSFALNPCLQNPAVLMEQEFLN
jgi:hypothetical protein